MAWGRGRSSYNNSEPPKPKAFSDSVAHQIDRAIQNVGLKLMVMQMEDFTYDDLKLLFVDPGQRDFLTKAYAATGGVGVSHMQLFVRLPGGSGNVRFMWNFDHTDGAFFVPANHGSRGNPATPRPDAPEPLLERYNNMAEALERTSREWGLVRWVFGQLNQYGYCNTPPQMRYVWGAIPTLLQYAGLHDQAKALITPSSRAGDKARIPTAAQPYIRETYDIVTRSILVDDMQRRPTVSSSKLSIDITDMSFTVAYGNNESVELSGVM